MMMMMIYDDDDVDEMQIAITIASSISHYLKASPMSPMDLHDGRAALFAFDFSADDEYVNRGNVQRLHGNLCLSRPRVEIHQN